jgi:hypothetical protein
MVRTDAIAVDGLDAAIDRDRRYVDAGGGVAVRGRLKTSGRCVSAPISASRWLGRRLRRRSSRRSCFTAATSRCNLRDTHMFRGEGGE